MAEVIDLETGVIVDSETRLPVVYEQVVASCQGEECENFQVELTVTQGAVYCGACESWIVAPEETPA